MVHESEIIHVDPGTDLDRLLEDVGSSAIVLERRGVRYRLQRESLAIADENDIWANYDPERARAAIRKAAGAWSDLDTDAMKESIYRARDEGSRPPDRPSAISSIATG